MNKNGLLLNYFREPEAAQEALQTLDRKGFRRRILLQAMPEGHITRRDPSRRIRNTLILAGGFILSTTSVTLAVIGLIPRITTPTVISHFLITFIGFGFGAGVGALISAQLFPVVSRDVINRQENWLSTEESLLILQAPMRSLSRAVRTLRDKLETDISIFALHPRREFPEPPILRELTALPLPQIESHASRLAREHQVDFHGESSRALLNQLENARLTIHAICSDLTESVRLEQNMSPVAEWILDNEYLIESHGRDVEINLPKSFFRELPTLSVDPDRNYPRVYSLAKELVTHSDARIDHENLLTFLSAYQEVASLTIGELWALPLMLRIALIQRVELLTRQAARELRDREFADFWANRLLSTLRRDPNQLFGVLAELAEERGNPSPFFATQLSGHLYDEDAALIPVQSWLERSLRKSLTELHTA
ncbi:MAG TPA: glycosyl transferase, partial [Chloroflexi bacterium]|nr:glycosyl transferase [Chloroflexota bacterium]